MTKPITTRPTVAEFLTDRIAASDKTQREIAEECGFDNPNMVTMMKQGHSRVPINRICSLAKALEVDPAHLLRVVLLEYQPEVWQSIEEAVESTVLTKNELAMVRAFRSITGESDRPAVVMDRTAVIVVVPA
jgi:transcriptional regulator with XRE-family HTH domain